MRGTLGRYQIVREIASGGMATVYLGRIVGEGGFERLVALKVMHPHIASDSDFVAMFYDEARLAARIRHPNVVPTIDIDRTADGLCLVMEYIEGTTLYDIRKYHRQTGERLPLPVVFRVVLDALNGLHAAHNLVDNDGVPLKLVHRDVSPQNVLIGKDGIARITDFGVARAEARITTTRSGQLKGKMAYMPPEQVMGETVDRRSDVYAAGVVLWEAMTGRRLMRLNNEGALVHKIVSGGHDAPHTVNDKIPVPVSEVCMRALSRDMNERFATAENFAEALEDAARDAALPPARPKHVGKFITDLEPQMLAVGIGSSDQLTPLSGKLPPPRLPKPRAPSPSQSAIVPGARPPAESGEFSALTHISEVSQAYSFGNGATHTEAVLSVAARRSRQGAMFVGVVGAIGLVAVAALAIGTLTNSPDPHTAATGPPSGPAAGQASQQEVGDGAGSKHGRRIDEPEPDPKPELVSGSVSSDGSTGGGSSDGDSKKVASSTKKKAQHTAKKKRKAYRKKRSTAPPQKRGSRQFKPDTL